MIVNYNSKKTTVQKIGVPSLYGFEGNHIKLSTTKAKEMITSTMSTFDQLSDKGILSAISARKSLYEIDNLIRSSMEEYGDLDEETESLPIKRNTKLIPIIAIDDVTVFLLIQVAIILRMRISSISDQT
jgi:hypothetical protein